MRQHSIGFRLTVWYAAVLSLGLILFSVALRYMLARELYDDLQSSLSDQLAGFDRYLGMEDEDAGIQLKREIDEYSRSMQWNQVVAVYSADGRVFYQSRQDEGVWRSGDYLVGERAVRLREGRFQIRIGISRKPVEQVLGRLTMLLVAIVPVFIFAGCAGGYWLSRRALRPVRAMSEKAQSIGLDNLSERLTVPRTRDEIQHLAETWNGMLERLEEAVTRVTQFTADASHELRTPVAIVRLAAEKTLRRTRTDAEYSAALRQIQAESERMTELIENLLYLARTDAGVAGRTGHHELDVVLLANSVCEDFESVAANAGVSIERRFTSRGAVVRASEAELRRLICILIDNSIKYTQTGGRVSVSVGATAEHVTISVADTGIGIPEDIKGRVFERFFRVDASRSKQSGGFGLGLSIGQTIARRHGTEIELETREGAGSTFYVKLRPAENSDGADRLVGSTVSGVMTTPS